MANYSESYLCFVGLMGLLTGDTTLAGLAPGGVYREMVPAGASTPYVIIGQQSSQDTITATADRIFSRHLFRIEAHGPASQADTVAQAAARIDKILGGPPNRPITQTIIVNSVTEGIMLDVHREQPLQLDEVINTSEQWVRFGGMYRILLQQVAS